jgi:phosphate transport system substrate-binding protein
MKKILSLIVIGLIGAALASAARAERLVLAGSTTILPIVQKAAEEFMQQNPNVDMTVRGGGSGVGIAALIDGTCDIADSSRAIKDAELDKAVSNGRDPKATVIAMDGIAVIVNPSNSVKALSKKQLKDIFTGAVSDWSQVGGTPGKIVVVSRDSSSGTFEAFGMLALDGAKVRPDALMQASNQAVASTVGQTPEAIGYVGLGFISGAVKALEINGVMPTKETVLTNKYSLGRPLFMYTNGAPKGLAKDLIDFIKGPQGEKIVDEEGFVGLK